MSKKKELIKYPPIYIISPFVNRIYNSYKTGAFTRNLEFELDIPDIEHLIFKPCDYCGEASSNQSGGIKYNGIDRVDNEKGYIKDNVVSCCKHCNYSKRARTKREFLQWVELVYNKSVVGNTWLEDRTLPQPEYHPGGRKNNPWVINLLEQGCHYCGSTAMVHSQYTKKNYDIYRNLDLIKHKEGYIEGNIIPICDICHRAKGGMKHDEFLDWSNKLQSHIIINVQQPDVITNQLYN